MMASTKSTKIVARAAWTAGPFSGCGSGVKRALCGIALVIAVLWAFSLWPGVAIIAAAWLFSLVIAVAFAWGYGVYYAISHAAESQVRVVRIRVSEDVLARADRLAKSDHTQRPS